MNKQAYERCVLAVLSKQADLTNNLRALTTDNSMSEFGRQVGSFVRDAGKQSPALRAAVAVGTTPIAYQRYLSSNNATASSEPWAKKLPKLAPSILDRSPGFNQDIAKMPEYVKPRSLNTTGDAKFFENAGKVDAARRIFQGIGKPSGTIYSR